MPLVPLNWCKQEKHARGIASHALINHKGAVFLHFFDTAMILLESLPSIEKCAGGAVEDYRHESVQSLVQRSRLIAATGSGSGSGAPRRIQQQQLLHETKYFPLVRREAIALDHPDLAHITDALRMENIDRGSLDRCLLQVSVRGQVPRLVLFLTAFYFGSYSVSRSP